MTAVQLPALSSQAGYPVPSAYRGGPDDEQVPSSRLFSVLWRRKWLILAVVLVVVPPAALLIRQIPQYYDAQAALMINTRKASFRDLQATVEATDADAVAIGTQVGIIRSSAMALRVVDRLDLTHKPEFSATQAPSFTSRVQARVRGWFGVRTEAAAPPAAADQRQFAGLQLARAVSVQNDGHSYIITVQARTGDPALSAAIANAFADIYLDFNRQLKIAAIRRANLLLDDEMAPMRARLRQADEAVETYRQTNGLITGRSDQGGAPAGGSATVSEAQLAQINAELITATDEAAVKQASLRQIQAALHSGQVDSIPEVVGSALISTLRAQQTELSSRVASLSQNQLPGNPALRSAMAGSADISRRINAEVAKIAASVASQAAAAQSRVATLRAALGRLQGTVAVESRANVTLRQLESEAGAARNVYQDYLGRFEHTSSDAALQEPEADLISPALVPLGRSGPPRGQLMALALAAALGLGSLLALVLDRMRQGIRSTEQLERAVGLFGLGLVPTAPHGVRRAMAAPGASAYTGAIGLVTNMLRHGGDQIKAQVVLVTSAAPGEGKTSLSIALAAGVAREGARALVIDCDLHKPAVARELRLEGVAPVAPAGKAPPKALLRQAVMPGLDVLTFPDNLTQWSPGLADTLRQLIQDARGRYDLVVLDTPPVLAFADAPILSLQADGVILAVRWRHTPVAAVASAVRMLNAYGVRLLGGVITQVKLKELDAAEGGAAHLYRAHAQYFR